MTDRKIEIYKQNFLIRIGYREDRSDLGEIFSRKIRTTFPVELLNDLYREINSDCLDNPKHSAH